METKTLLQKATAWIKKHPILSIIGIIVLIKFISNMSDLIGKNSETPTVVKQETSQPLSFEDKVKSIIATARSTDLSFKEIKNRDADNDKPAGSKMITISINIDKYYKSEYLLKNADEISSKLFQEAFASNKNVSDVIVWYYTDITDKYGNKQNKILISQAIDRVTFEKINWQNFDDTKLCDFLKSEEDSNGGQTACVVLAKIQ